ncbi:MAG: Bax inhibitor-1 family protein [Acidithiobacillus sp.]
MILHKGADTAIQRLAMSLCMTNNAFMGLTVCPRPPEGSDHLHLGFRATAPADPDANPPPVHRKHDGSTSSLHCRSDAHYDRHSPVAEALGTTAAGSAGLSLYGMTAKRDFSRMGGFLMTGLITAILGSLLNLFLLHPPMLQLACHGSPIWRHFRVTIMAPPWGRHNGATSGSA